ncbi:MAG: hypothetical protein QG568_120 [Patescibacteria group bacterium]|nr:hypothetical protein [Patescibacteria group bacterium]
MHRLYTLSVKILELLLPWDEFNKRSYPQPYIYRIGAKGNILIYFGAKHSLDAKHEQNEQIKEQWESFLVETISGRRKVVAEVYSEGLFLDENHAVTARGESGLISYLAKRENIEVVIPGLGKQEQMKICDEYFSRDMILYHHALQIALQWNRLEDKPPFDQFIEKFLMRDKEGTDWDDTDFTLEHIKNIHESLFGQPFDQKDKDFFSRMTDPSQFHSITNEISRKQNDLREVQIIDTIVKIWDEGNSVFVVMGSGHAIIEEPALRILL